MDDARDDASAPGGTPRYDAFVSYRHAEPDRTWARWLQGALESYRTPRALVRGQGLRPRLTRVFRDEDELPASADLSAQIEDALLQSRFLIVVCSPRTPASAWVNQEIVRFREMGRDDRILALLVEGEPAEAFPRALLEIRRHVTDATGKTREEIEEVEPLAADVRPSRSDPPRWLKRMAKLRMLACLLGCRFDDLRQREQERRTRRLAVAGVALAALVALFAGLSVVALKQRAAAEAARNVAHERLLDFHVEQGRRELIQGDRRRALVYLNEALGEGRDTPLIRFLLARARNVLDAEAHVLGRLEEGELRLVSFAANDTRILTIDDMNAARIYDARSGEEIARILDLDPQVDAALAALSAGDGTRAVLRVRRDDKPALVGFDFATLERTWQIEGPPGAGPAKPVAIGGRVLAVGTPDGRVQLIDLRTGTPTKSVRAHTRPLEKLALDAEGRRAAALTIDGECVLWDISAGAAVRRVPAPSGVVEPPRILDDGRRILFQGPESVWLVDVGTGSTVFQQAVDGWHDLTAVASPNGALVLVQGAYGPLQLWAAGVIAKGAAAPRLQWDPGHEDQVSAAAFAPDTRRLVTASWDATLRVWDLEGGVERLLLQGHAGGIKSVAWSRDGTRLVSGATDGTARVWNLDAATLLSTLEMEGGRVDDLRHDGASNRLVALTNDGYVAVWNLETGEPAGHLPPPGGALMGAALDATGRLVVHHFEDGTAVVRDVATGEVARTLRGPAAAINGVRFGPMGTTLTASMDGTAIVWRGDGSRRLVLRGHEGSVFEAVSDPGGSTVATAGIDGTLRLWNATTGEARHVLRKEGAVSLGMPAFSPSGDVVAARASQGSVVGWDVDTGHELFVLAGHGAAGARAFCYSPSGDRLATAGEDGTTNVWDVATGGLLFSLRRPALGRASMGDEVGDVVFHPDGRFLATADGDGRFRIWELDRGRLVAELEGDGHFTYCCQYTADGEVLLTGGADGSVLLHDLSLETSTPAAFDQMVDERVPFRLVDGVMKPREN